MYVADFLVSCKRYFQEKSVDKSKPEPHQPAAWGLRTLMVYHFGPQSLCEPPGEARITSDDFSFVSGCHWADGKSWKQHCKLILSLSFSLSL